MGWGDVAGSLRAWSNVGNGIPVGGFGDSGRRKDCRKARYEGKSNVNAAPFYQLPLLANLLVSNELHWDLGMYPVPLWSNAIHQVLRKLLPPPQPPLEVQEKLYPPYHQREMDVSADPAIHSIDP